MVCAGKKFYGTDFLRGACFFLFIYRGLVARGPADSAHKQKRTVSTGNGPNQLGYKDSNLEMLESESSALPFGDSPSQALIILDGF